MRVCSREMADLRRAGTVWFTSAMRFSWATTTHLLDKPIETLLDLFYCRIATRVFSSFDVHPLEDLFDSNSDTRQDSFAVALFQANLACQVVALSVKKSPSIRTVKAGEQDSLAEVFGATDHQV